MNRWATPAAAATAAPPDGAVYRETTPATVARVTAAPDERIGRVEAFAPYLLRERRDSPVVDGRRGPLTWGA